MIRVVPIDQVVPLKDSSSYGIRKMVAVLQKQGQIEPLQVHPIDSDGEKFIVFEQDAWANEIVFAARALEWPTLLVGITDTYEY